MIFYFYFVKLAKRWSWSLHCRSPPLLSAHSTTIRSPPPLFACNTAATIAPTTVITAACTATAYNSRRHHSSTWPCLPGCHVKANDTIPFSRNPSSLPMRFSYFPILYLMLVHGRCLVVQGNMYLVPVGETWVLVNR